MAPHHLMHRCLQLAARGLGTATPNPVVGAVLVHEGRIIGEGFHHHPGGPHAEVVCVHSVAPEDAHLIADSMLYVSLEPCSHHGRTPPCTDLILGHRIKKVVVGCVDPYPEVAGTGIQRLRESGVEVAVSVAEEECLFANRRFFTAHTKGRPYVVLKWAQTADGFIGSGTEDRLMISGAQTCRTVHRWRSEEAAILIGKSTALLDDPSLTVRHWPGVHPLRVVVDRSGTLPQTLQVFTDGNRTLLLTESKNVKLPKPVQIEVLPQHSGVQQVLEALHKQQVQSVLVEGGQQVLQAFLDAGLWDEVRMITNTGLFAGSGVAAPKLPPVQPQETTVMGTDTIHTFYQTEYFYS